VPPSLVVDALHEVRECNALNGVVFVTPVSPEIIVHPAVKKITVHIFGLFRVLDNF
jgi:hypothetical protein